ncbi:hypothetical protein Cni_G12187 [Canna indica]|uniref:RING-type domain-containing protein n=1 Tax=Canna indica TaxID=4628 RepID=A0AAQ3KBF2_9LILI|nr:hypothetical protein Cni_G12187 [Canna indica]
MPNEQVLVTPCNHMFHNVCLVSWVKGHGKCPVCSFVLCEKENAMVRSNNNGVSFNYGYNYSRDFG